MKPRPGEYEAVVMGASAGGLEAVTAVLVALPDDLDAPIIVVQHRSPEPDDRLSDLLDRRCRLPVRGAEDKEALQEGRVYIAPSDYHLLVERDRTLSLSLDPKVNHARPSVDVLFESAAEVYCERLVGVVLTGAGKDGANGLRKIDALEGAAIVQDPATAVVASMPEAALREVPEARVVPLKEIGSLLVGLCGTTAASDE